MMSSVMVRIVLTCFVNCVDRIFRQIRLGVEAEMYKQYLKRIRGYVGRKESA